MKFFVYLTFPRQLQKIKKDNYYWYKISATVNWLTDPLKMLCVTRFVLRSSMCVYIMDALCIDYLSLEILIRNCPFSHIPTEYQTASKLLCPFRNKLQYNRCRKWLRIGHMVQQDVTEEGTIARNIGNHMYTSDESECITNCINSSSPSHEVDC
jgi:hypothetical protein